jgi:hypothetical protein
MSERERIAEEIVKKIDNIRAESMPCDFFDNIARYIISELEKAKQEGYKKGHEEIALLCAKKLKDWSSPGAASCAFDEARYAVKKELKEIKAFCNKKIINEGE